MYSFRLYINKFPQHLWKTQPNKQSLYVFILNIWRKNEQNTWRKHMHTNLVHFHILTTFIWCMFSIYSYKLGSRIYFYISSQDSTKRALIVYLHTMYIKNLHEKKEQKNWRNYAHDISLYFYIKHLCTTFIIVCFRTAYIYISCTTYAFILLLYIICFYTTVIYQKLVCSVDCALIYRSM